MPSGGGDPVSAVRARPDRKGLAFARQHGPILLVTVAFAVSRGAAYGAGVRFDAGTLEDYWQYISPDLLKTRLLESLFYLHGQPPLFNLLLGVVLKLAPDHFAGAMHAVYLVLGLILSLAMYLVLVRVGLSRWTSAVVAALLSATPAFLLYENWLFYEYPVAALLVLSALALSQFLRRETFLSASAFFVLLASIIYARSLFQIAWLLLALGLLLAVRPDLRRTVLLASALPVLVVLLLIVKNMLVFGVPTTSSWFGMNLAQVVYYAIPAADRRPYVERGELSRVSLIEPFSAPADYLPLVPAPRTTGKPVLDRFVKSEGSRNLNNKIMIDVSRDYLRDSLHMIRVRPRAYARAIVDGGKLYLRPTNIGGQNQSNIEAYNDLFNRVVLLQTRYLVDFGWTILAAHVFALIYGLRLTYRLLRRRLVASVASVTLAYVWLTLAYTTVLVTFAQVAENDRIRFLLDPLVVILVAVPVCDALRSIVHRASSHGASAAV